MSSTDVFNSSRASGILRKSSASMLVIACSSKRLAFSSSGSFVTLSTVSSSHRVTALVTNESRNTLRLPSGKSVKVSLIFVSILCSLSHGSRIASTSFSLYILSYCSCRSAFTLASQLMRKSPLSGTGKKLNPNLNRRGSVSTSGNSVASK
jgi:hypothetical protein